MKLRMRIYLDVCCYNRPFDDPSIERNRLEAEAVVAIIARVEKGKHSLASSEAVDREVNACPDAEKAEIVRSLLKLARLHVVVAKKEADRWAELIRLGFNQLDALHLACAEAARCEAFLTVDDPLLRRAKAVGENLKVKVLNPLAFVMEVQP